MGGGTVNALVLLGGLLFSGGGIAALITARTQKRSSTRADTREDRRVDLEMSESTNRQLSAALDFFKEELDDERTRHADDVRDLRARVKELEAGA